MSNDPRVPASQMPSNDDLRSSLLAEVPESFLGDELVARYPANCGIPATVEISERMVLDHWTLERELTRRLRESAPESRAAVFVESYDKLYRSLPWLNRGEDEGAAWDTILAGDLLSVAGRSPIRILELGAGRCRIAKKLSEAGHIVRASNLTCERRPAWIAEAKPGSVPGRHESSSLAPDWIQLDAVRPDAGDSGAPYDLVVSIQMIEHLHPDDVGRHFEGVLRLLEPSGRYAFTTPHAFLGPADLSRVFGARTPMGMHLREYTTGELTRTALEAGFTRVEAGFRAPYRIARLTGIGGAMRGSQSYRRYLEGWEALLSVLPAGSARRAAARALRILLFRETVIIARR